MAYPYNGKLLSSKKQWATDTQYNIDASDNNYAEWKKPDKYEYILWDSIYIKFSEIEMNVSCHKGDHCLADWVGWGEREGWEEITKA